MSESWLGGSSMKGHPQFLLGGGVEADSDTMFGLIGSRLLWICFVYQWEWTLGLWLGNREGRLKWEKGVEYSVSHWWQELEQGRKNGIIFGFSTVSYCLKQQAQGLPEKNVALMIRKEQLITTSNDDLMVIFVLTGRQSQSLVLALLIWREKHVTCRWCYW